MPAGSRREGSPDYSPSLDKFDAGRRARAPHRAALERVMEFLR